MAFSTANCIACDWASAGARNPQRMHGDVLFIEGRDELLAKPLEKKQRPAKKNHGDRRSPAGASAIARCSSGA